MTKIISTTLVLTTEEGRIIGIFDKKPEKPDPVDPKVREIEKGAIEFVDELVEDAKAKGEFKKDEDEGE